MNAATAWSEVHSTVRNAQQRIHSTVMASTYAVLTTEELLQDVLSAMLQFRAVWPERHWNAAVPLRLLDLRRARQALMLRLLAAN